MTTLKEFRQPALSDTGWFLWCAKIHGRQHGAHGRPYTIDIEFTAHRDNATADTAIAAANVQGFEVMHVEGIYQIKPAARPAQETTPHYGLK